MTVRINNTVCSWRRNVAESGGTKTISRGSAWRDERYYDGESLVRHIANCAAAAPTEQRLDVLRELAVQLDGSWAFVVEWPDGETIAAVDRLRSIPLFYGRTPNDDLVMANDVRDLADCRDAGDLDDGAIIELLLSSFVIGARTLRSGIRQLQTGEILHWINNKLHLSRYYRFLRDGWSTAGRAALTNRLGEVMDEVFSRYVRQFADRRIYVPLSGGLDSRLILAMLKRHGHRDLVAFNYGPVGSTETEISKAVAETAGVPWKHVPYEECAWKPLVASSEMREFWRYAGQDAMLPHIQDYPALRMLREKDQRLDAVFFSGMAGDMIAGAWVPDHFTDNEGPLDVGEVCRWMYYRKYVLWPSRRRERQKVLDRMARFFEQAPLGPVHNSAAAFDLFEFENRQAKYIVNSVRSFEYHGFEWRLPLCANELMDFHLTVPTELRELKRLYALWMRDRVFVGPLARLAEIAPSGDGSLVWYDKTRPIRRAFGNVLWRHTRGILKRSVLRHFAEWRIASGVMRSAFQPLHFSKWFIASDEEGKSRTLGELLAERDGPFDGLPPAAAEFASRFRNYPVCLTIPLGQLALAYLATVKRGQPTW